MEEKNTCDDKYSQRLKSEHFGFRTGDHCSVINRFEQTKLSEIRTNCSDFRHKFVSEI